MPVTLGGISTMVGLPDIQSQTKALPDNVAAFYQTLATGSGPNGTIVVGDILGASVGYGYTERFVSVTEFINKLYSAGSLNALIATYVSMLSAMDDAELLLLIAQANADISAVAGANAATVDAINAAWLAMASKLNKEYLFQQKADIVWADIPANSQTSVMALIQGLPGYALDVEAGGSAWYIDQIADTATQGGQAIVGTLREARNNQRLNASQLSLNTAPSYDPAVIPVPVVRPVN